MEQGEDPSSQQLFHRQENPHSEQRPPARPAMPLLGQRCPCRAAGPILLHVQAPGLLAPISSLHTVKAWGGQPSWSARGEGFQDTASSHPHSVSTDAWFKATQWRGCVVADVTHRHPAVGTGSPGFLGRGEASVLRRSPPRPGGRRHGFPAPQEA